MRGRCESYGHYDYTIGHCHAQHSDESDIIDDDGNVIKKSGEKYNEDGVRALY